MPITSLDLLIPFFFILAIVWGALEVSGVFKNKGVKAIISLVIGFFAITNQQAVSFINQSLPFAVMFFVVIFFIGFITKPFIGKKKEGGEGPDFTLLAIVGILILLFLASQGTDYLRTIFPGLSQFSQNDLLTGLGIIIVILILFSVYKRWGGEK